MKDEVLRVQEDAVDEDRRCDEQSCDNERSNPLPRREEECR
jgi:hypothetical protein